MSDKPPVKRHVGTDRAALLAFVKEAAHHGCEIVFVASDVADALGAPTSTLIPVLREHFLPDGFALAMPRAIDALAMAQEREREMVIARGIAASEVARLTSENQRLRDLVRHQRGPLHDAELLTDEEYAALAADSGAVARLEGYDTMRAELNRLRGDLEW